MTAAFGSTQFSTLPAGYIPDGQKITFKGRFTCPSCQAACEVVLDVEAFACPRCGRGFAILEQGGKKAYTPRTQGPAWLAGSQQVRPFEHVTRLALAPGMPVTLGAARQRREKRRSGALRLVRSAILALAIALLLVSRFLLTPSLAQGDSPTAPVVPGQSSLLAAAARPAASPTATPTLHPSASASSTPAATAASLATATPLPPELVSATAWSQTLAEAGAGSHATQTAVMQNYAATQTALPAIITALAEDRSATATQKAAATAAARSKAATATARALWNP